MGNRSDILMQNRIWILCRHWNITCHCRGLINISYRSIYHYKDKSISLVWKPKCTATASFYSLGMKDIVFGGNFGYWIKHHLCDSGTRDKTTYLQTFLIGNKDQVSKLFREQFTRHPEIPRDPFLIFVLNDVHLGIHI